MELQTIKTLRGGVIYVSLTNKPNGGKSVKTNYFNGWKLIEDDIVATSINQLLNDITNNNKKEEDLIVYLNSLDINSLQYTIGDRYSKESKSITPSNDTTQSNDLLNDALTQQTLDTIDHLNDFMIELNYTPSIRFLNTLILTDSNKRKDYIKNYFELSGRPETPDLIEKMKSEEFKDLLAQFDFIRTKSRVNKRLQIYFGEPGTGKTYKAIKENPNAKVMICESDFMPSQLFKVFDFNDENGKPQFKDSALVEAMNNGEKIVIDEINLLNNQCLRALQEITDNKDSFEYDGRNYIIKDGFEIIGTMNLYVNGSQYGLPEPLVDRCSNIKEFKISTKKTCELAGLI